MLNSNYKKNIINVNEKVIITKKITITIVLTVVNLLMHKKKDKKKNL